MHTPRRHPLGTHLTFAAALGVTGCGDSDLRGSFQRSSDGKTYLMVVDDNGGGCTPIRVDGRVWRHSKTQRAEITPGMHTIDCGPGGSTGIGFTVPAGVVYKFDYWGP